MGNEEMRRDWSEGAAGWVQNEATFDAVFAPITTALLGAAAIAPGERLLDVGCGTGTLLAAGVAAGATVVGVDISPGMVEAARRRVPKATIVVADAESVELLAEVPGPPFEAVISRFGVMFFLDPVAAFANIRRATGPQARITFACWRGRAENPMFTLGNTVLEEHLGPRQAPPPDAPGPMAFADRDRLLGVLTDAGWACVAIEPLDTMCDYGINGSDGVDERLATILSTSAGRSARAALEPSLGAEGWANLLDEVRADLRRQLVDGVVRFPAATWLVTARHPAPSS